MSSAAGRPHHAICLVSRLARDNGGRFPRSVRVAVSQTSGETHHQMQQYLSMKPGFRVRLCRVALEPVSMDLVSNMSQVPLGL
jgi:hypothetical protein